MHVLLYIETKLFRQDLTSTMLVSIKRIVFYESNKYSTHAELDAIRKIKNKNILRECKIVIGKINNNNIEQGIPCDMCTNLLKKYGIKKICNIDRKRE